MNKELCDRALSGDKDAMEALQKEVAETGKEIVVMQRCLQSHFHSSDGQRWFLDAVVWSPWHRKLPGEPEYYVDAQDGRAFRTIKREERIKIIDSKFLDPETIPELLELQAATWEKDREKRTSLEGLRKLLQEAVASEDYEKAARLRDEIEAKAGVEKEVVE